MPLMRPDRRGMTIAMVAGLLCCTSVSAVLSVTTVMRARPTVAALTSARDSAQRTTVWIVFRAPDCGLSAELIDALNRVDRTERVQVVGVMLLPPYDAVQQATLATALGMEFDIVHDVDGVWRRALQRDRQRDPVLYVREGTTLLGGVSPSFLKSFAALDLDGVPMERER